MDPEPIFVNLWQRQSRIPKAVLGGRTRNKRFIQAGACEKETIEGLKNWPSHLELSVLDSYYNLA